MKNVIISGASGFVGKNLITYLGINGVNISILKREDYLNDIPLNNVDTVIHLAGKAHDLKKTSDPDEYYQVNYELTKKLYDFFLKSEAKQFIFVSSVKAAADSVDDILTENIIPAPRTHYGKSKLMAEQYIQSEPLPDSKFYYILRPCMIHGPGNKGNLNLLFKFVQKGIPYPLASFKNKRSFLSIENLNFIINEIISQDIASGVYQVADDEPLSTTDLIEILSESVGKQSRLLYVNQKIIRFLAKIGDVFKLPLNTEHLNKLTENYVVSNEKIKNAINKSLPISAKAGLRLTAESFKKD